ncbi:glycosyltransferase family 39 protein, partial [Oscillochloris sp. ZM17-4]
MLIGILLVGAYFRTLSLTDWDDGTGQHPDERFFTDVASNVHLPSGLGELYDSARSPLNPRSYNQFPMFVYGPFPIYATRFVAAALTPNEALPEQVRGIAGPPRMGADPSAPNETRTDFGPLVDNPERAIPKIGPLIALLNPDGVNLTGYGEIVKVGRTLAMLFDLGSILMVFLIARRLFDARVGLLAAALLALSVMPIQQSHFFVDPIFSTFFALVSLYWAVRVAQGGSWLSYAALGVSIGAAMANRITLATLGLVAVAAALLAASQFAQRSRQNIQHSPFTIQQFFDRFLTRELPLLMLAGALTLLAFRTLSPDSFSGSLPSSPEMVGPRIVDIGLLQGKGYLDFRPDPRFIANLTTVRGLVSGEYDFPPSQQWVGRAAYLFPWTNMVLWGMGPALGLAAWAGWILFGVLSVWRSVGPKHSAPTVAPEPSRWRWAQNASALPLWVWVGFYFGWQGAQFAITMRYLLPIYGALIIFAAWLLVGLWDWGTGDREQGTGDRGLGRWLFPHSCWALVAVLLLTLGWAYAFSRIYTQPHSRVIAARWLADHAPPGSQVMAEVWDDPLPLQSTPASWGGTYFGISSAPYAEDEPRKYVGAYNRDGTYDDGLLDQLDQADYITLTSNRVYASTSRLRMRYPALMNYYRSLFDGSLGFTLAAEVTSYPNILGVQIPDQGAEEAFSVYDHPRVLIFQKTPAYSRQRAEELITQPVIWGEVYKSPVNVADRNATALRLTAGQWPRYTTGGTWLDLYPQGVWAAVAPLSWVAVLELLGLAAFALLFRLLPGLPDRGFSIAKTLGLLGVAYLAWLLGSLGNGTGLPGMAGSAAAGGLPLLPLPFTPGTLWLCAAPLLAGGAYAAWRQREELRAFAGERRAALLSAEGIFLGFLLLGLLLRWLNPDLWHPARGGEKPMDFAYLNAVLKSAAFPPYDPWHAGGYINYYYFGFVIVGALIHLSGVAPSVGYNLAVATLFGLTALGAWGVVFNLLAPGGIRGQGSGIGGQAEDETQSREARSPTPAPRSPIIAAALAPALLLLLGNLAQAFWYLSGYAAAQLPKGRPEWAFWDATRIVDGTVNEFPFFTFLFADLHAHMIVMPLSLALLGMGVAWVRGQGTGDRGQGTGDRGQGTGDRGQGIGSRWLRPYTLSAVPYTLLMGLLAGAIRVTNTWDYPTFVGLTMLTVAWATFRFQRAAARSPLIAMAAGILAPLAFVLVGNLLFAPFTANFATESSGVAPLIDGGVPGLLGGLLAAERTSVWELIQLYGLWVFVAAAAGLLLIRRLAGPLAAGGLAGVLSIVAIIGSLMGWPALSLTLPMLAVGALLLWQLRRLPTRSLLPILWGVAAIGLLAMVDLVVVKGDVGRLNTVFKFGLHAWTLFALSAAVALPRIWVGDRGQGTGDRIRRASIGIWSVRGSLALLIIAALVYPLTATPARLADRWDPGAPHTLDGAAFMRTISEARNGQGNSLDEDAAAISWLQQNVPGTPVILEAHLPSYQWAGRIATFTGLPTILGWEWHQVQQRNVVGAGPVIAARQQTVAEIYSTPDPQRALDDLHQYGVEYLYVGGVERATYDAAGLSKFPAMVASGDLAVAFQSGQTTIYRVTKVGRPEMLTSDVPLVPPTERTPPPLMLREPVNELPAVDEYAWNGLARGSSWAATIFWLLAIYGLAALGMPVARLVFGRAADGGAAWAKVIGLLLLGYAVWLPASLGLWRYDAWGVAGGLVIVLAINVAALIAGEGRIENEKLRVENAKHSQFSILNSQFLGGLRATGASLRDKRRAVIIGELVFLGGFAAMAIIRALNPDLWHPVWGGEKPMEFGFLNAILRSPVMPPYDPFFSGGYINYYYYGLYLVSLPMKITGIEPAMGFNLAVATLLGLTLAGAFAVVARITGRARYGLVGAGLVGLAGNLTAIVASGWSRGLPALRQALADGGLAGIGARLGDWYIGPSRVIPFTINEFPAFTFLFADLHPHMIALPIGLLAAGVAYEVRAQQRAPRAAAPLLALALGALAVTNSWDFPTYALLGGLAIVGAAWRKGDHIGSPLRAAGLAIAVAVGGLVMYAPFFDRYFAFVRGVGAVPLSGGTTIPDYLLVFGVPLAILLPALGGAAWRTMRLPRTPAFGRWAVIGLATILAVAAIAVPSMALRAALALLLLLAGAVLLRRRVGPAAWFTLLLAWVAWAVSLGVELIYIRDHLDGGDWFRMNTVFKFGLQAWVLLGLAAAASLPASLRALRRLGGKAAQTAGVVALAALGLLAAVYPLAATLSRVANRFDVQTGPTLDGLAFMRQTSFGYDCAAYGGCPPGVGQVTVDLRGDATAIGWLNREISGTPIVVQSDLWFYRAYGIRIAANTGLPTVISALHENEQRDPTLTGRRDADLADFYTTTDIDGALRFLAKYQVNYIYVGGVEHAFYPA